MADSDQPEPSSLSVPELWKRYREATFRNDEETASETVREILQQVPGDPDAAKELERIEKRQSRRKQEALKEAIACEDGPAVIRLLGEMEALGDDSFHGSDLFHQADRVRGDFETAERKKKCRSILDRLNRQMEDEKYAEVADSIKFLRAAKADGIIDLSEDEDTLFKNAQDWRVARDDERTERREFDTLVTAVRATIVDLEMIGRSIAKMPQKDLLEAYQTFDNDWKKLLRFQIDLPPDVRTDAPKQLRFVEEELERRRRQSMRWKLVAGGIALLVIAALAFGTFVFWRSHQITDEVERLIAEKNMSPLEELVSETRSSPLPFDLSSRLKTALHDADQKLADWTRQIETLESEIPELIDWAEGGFTGDSHDAAYRRITTLEESLDAIPTDRQKELRGSLVDVFARWQIHETGMVRGVTEERKSLLTEITAHLAENNRPKTAVSFPRYMEKLDQMLEKVVPLLDPANPDLAAEDYERVAFENADHEAGEIRKVGRFLESVLENCRAARTFAEFQKGVEGFLDPRLAALPCAKAASTITGLEFDYDRFRGELLMPDDPNGWNDFIGRTDHHDSFPSQVSDTDRKTLLHLAREETLNHLYRCEFKKGSKSETLFASGQPTNVVVENRHICKGVFFNTERSEFQESEASEILGAGWQLNGDPVLSPESALLQELKLERLMSSSQRYFIADLFPVFDRINNASKVDCLFRAYLLHHLIGIIESRPNEWGLYWCPRLRNDISRVKRLGIASLSETSWLTAESGDLIETVVAEFFDQRGPSGYAKEAILNRSLVNSATSGGFHFAGFIGVDNSVWLHPEAEEATELVAVYGDGRKPSLACRRIDSDSGDPEDPGKAWDGYQKLEMLTPLFYPGEPARKIAREKHDVFPIPPGDWEQAVVSPYFPRPSN